MNRADCENLDTFLADDLSPGEITRFAGHLDECESCREAVDQQSWIDGLLGSPLAAALESPPATVLAHVASRAVRRRRQRRFIACGLATAAAIAVAVGWTVKLNRQASDSTGLVMNDVADAQAHSRANADLPQSTFVGGPDLIVVPVASRHPNVTVVRIYPTYEPDFSAQANIPTPAASEDFDWPLELNGG